MMKKLCENTIEDMKFELYTNNDKKCYQTLRISMKEGQIQKTTNMIAPIDFFEIASAIVCCETLENFIAEVKGAWSDEIIENMIGDLSNHDNIDYLEAKAEEDTLKSFDVYFDDE